MSALKDLAVERPDLVGHLPPLPALPEDRAAVERLEELELVAFERVNGQLIERDEFAAR